jgi:hypothetical protein
MINLRMLMGRYGRRVDLTDQIEAYRRIAPAVLEDLAEFCYATEPAPRNPDMFAQGRFAGRRDVWLRIQSHFGLKDHELYSLLKGEFITQPRS